MDITTSDCSSSSSPQYNNDTKSDEDILQSCLHSFGLPDAIVNSDIFSRLKAFVGAGGQPEHVVELLSDNYHGYATMANIAAEWVNALNDDNTSTSTATTTTAAATSSSKAKMSLEDVFENYFTDVVRHRFDPRVADTIWQKGEDGSTFSAEQLIEDAGWRRLLCELASTYSSCLLLDFAVQRISECGYQREVAAVATASDNLDVFKRVLHEALIDILVQSNAHDQCESFSRTLNEVLKTACHSAYSYVYTQTLLRALATNCKHGHIAMRVSQELSCYARVLHKHAVVDFDALLVSVYDTPDVARAFAAIQGMLLSNSVTPSDIKVLHQAPPPVEVLRRQPELLELLVATMFEPRKKINPQYRPMYAYVLAYAASSGGGEAELKGVQRALCDVQEVVANSTPLQSATATAQLAVFEHASVPVVAMGELHWIGRELEDRAGIAAAFTQARASAGVGVTSEERRSIVNVTTSLPATATPLILALLDEIATRHVLARPTIFEMVVAALERDYALDTQLSIELHYVLIERLVFLLGLGYALPPLLHLSKHVEASRDGTLGRYFAARVLVMISPPYGTALVAALRALLDHDLVGPILVKERGAADVQKFFVDSDTPLPDWCGDV